VDTVVNPEFFFEVEGLVVALFVFVPNDLMRTRNHAPRTSGTEAGVDDLLVELFPLMGPAFGGGLFGNGHLITLNDPPKQMTKSAIH
jgi:hypothetical protein